jgi:hypothetical protein
MRGLPSSTRRPATVWTPRSPLTGEFTDQGQVVSAVSSTPPSRRGLGPVTAPIRVPLRSETARSHVHAVVVAWADGPDESIPLGQEILHSLSHAEECHPEGWSSERRV